MKKLIVVGFAVSVGVSVYQQAKVRAATVDTKPVDEIYKYDKKRKEQEQLPKSDHDSLNRVRTGRNSSVGVNPLPNTDNPKEMGGVLNWKKDIDSPAPAASPAPPPRTGEPRGSTPDRQIEHQIRESRPERGPVDVRRDTGTRHV